MRRGTLIGLLAALLLLAAGAAPARAEVEWLCKPGVAPNPCDEPLDTTVQAPDGTQTVQTPTAPRRRRVDCFYVYPTVSEQTGVNAAKEKEPSVVAIAQYQASRFALDCDVYAPVYRQLTLSSIYTGSVEARAEGRTLAYADVREAFREYLRKDNHGRGFVLIGHSQGTGMLRQLMRQEVDPKPRVRRRLVSALLLGGNVLVRKDSVAGGDFARVPLCTAPAQTGCVVAFSTFGAAPPDNTRFGRSPAADTTGASLPAGPEYEVACTNPASLDANAASEFTSLLRSEPFPGVLGLILTEMYGGPPPTAETTWLQPRDRYSGRCEEVNGANVLLIAPVGDARTLNPAPTPDWGLHLGDANLPLGELVDLVADQSRAYLARPPKLRCRGKRVRGADRALVRSVKRRADGRVRVRLHDFRKVTLPCG